MLEIAEDKKSRMLLTGPWSIAKVPDDPQGEWCLYHHPPTGEERRIPLARGAHDAIERLFACLSACKGLEIEAYDSVTVVSRIAELEARLVVVSTMLFSALRHYLGQHLSLREVEKQLIIGVYLAMGNVRKSANLLGISNRKMHYKLKEYRDKGELPSVRDVRKKALGSETLGATPYLFIPTLTEEEKKRYGAYLPVHNLGVEELCAAIENRKETVGSPAHSARDTEQFYRRQQARAMLEMELSIRQAR